MTMESTCNRFGSRACSTSSMNLLQDRKSTRLNSSHTVIYTLSLHDALPILSADPITVQVLLHDNGIDVQQVRIKGLFNVEHEPVARSEEHTSELQSHSDLHSFPTRRSSDLERRSDYGASSVA